MARLLQLTLLLAGAGCLAQFTQFDGFFAGQDYLHGYLPPGTGHPLYMWVTGTHMPYETRADHDLLLAMAWRGFVAAQVSYPNDFYKRQCASVDDKASNIFQGDQSALAKLCAMEAVDCSKGVAVHGFSQGAHLASLARNYDGRVSAALLFGNSNFAHGSTARRLGLSSVAQSSDCLRYHGPPQHDFAREQVRSIAGAADEFMGSNLLGVIGHQKVTTGYDCQLGNDCIKPDGSGYYVVTWPAAATVHGFLYAQGSYEQLGGDFVNGDSPWGMAPCMDWLASAARRFAAGGAGQAPGHSSGQAPAGTAPTGGAGQGQPKTLKQLEKERKKAEKQARKQQKQQKQKRQQKKSRGARRQRAPAEKFASRPAAQRLASATRAGSLASGAALAACLLALAGGGAALARWRAAPRVGAYCSVEELEGEEAEEPRRGQAPLARV